MRIYIMALLLLLLQSAAFTETNIIDFNPLGGHRAYWPAPGDYIGGTMWTAEADPMDIWSQPLASKKPAGTYKLYILASARDGSKPDSQIEIGAANNIFGVKWKTTWSPEWVGPLQFRADRPFDVIQMRSDGYIAIDALYITKLTDDILPPGVSKTNPPISIDNWKSVWIDIADSHLHPAWYTEKDQIKARIRMNSSRGNDSAEIKCVVLDYNHKPVKSAIWHFKLTGKPQESVLNIDVPKKYGPYLLRFTAASGDYRQEYQHIVARIQSPLAFIGDERFGGHFWFTPHSEAMAAYIGVRSTRLWDVVGSALWRNVEPEKGVWKWDDKLASFPLGRISLLGVLETQPAWYTANMYTDPSDWLRYVSNTVSRYKGRIDYWELFNERFYQKTPDNEFADMVRKTISAVRKANPSAKIGGPCGPPEEVPGALEFWEGIGKQGLLKEFDFITGHFYVGGGGTYPIDQDVALDGMLGRIRNICNQYGARNKSIWNSEAGIGPNESFFVGRNTPYGIFAGSNFNQRDPVPYKVGAAMTARFALTHLWHNSRWYYYYCGGGYGNAWAMCDFPDLTPLPLAISYAQTNRMMKGAAAAGRIKKDGGLFGFRYNVNGVHCAVFWSLQLKPGEKRIIEWPKHKVTVKDLFGNPIIKAPTLEVGISPVYFFGNKSQVESALAAIKVTSKIDPQAGPQAIFLDLIDIKRKPAALLSTDSSVKNSKPENVRDAEKGAIWISVAGKGEHWVEYRWVTAVEVNRLQCEWPADRLPDGYRIEWWDGIEWRPCSPFYGGFRRPGLASENYLLSQPVKTDRLRMLIYCASKKSAAVTEFRAYHIPQLTSPIIEMQELWSKQFRVSNEGYILDWLVCGPFPSPGNRYESDGTKKIVNWETDFLVDDWIYGPNHPEISIKPFVGMKHAVRFPAVPGVPWKPMEVYVVWQPVHGTNGFVDISRSLMNEVISSSGKEVEQCFGYMFTNIRCPEDIEAKLSIGSDDGYRIWIDGVLVAEKQAFRSAVPDQESYPVKLTAGNHRILVKLHNDIGGHGLYMRFIDTRSGNPINNLDVSIKNPD